APVAVERAEIVEGGGRARLFDERVDVERNETLRAEHRLAHVVESAHPVGALVVLFELDHARLLVCGRRRGYYRAGIVFGWRSPPRPAPTSTAGARSRARICATAIPTRSCARPPTDCASSRSTPRRISRGSRRSTPCRESFRSCAGRGPPCM